MGVFWRPHVGGPMKKRLGFALVVMLVSWFSTASAQATEFTLSIPYLPQIGKAQPAWWEMAPANFMAEGRNNIYLENTKRPMQAWFLAFAPGAWGLTATFINKYFEQNGDEDTLKDSKFYFAAIPLAMGSLYADRKIESLIMTLGQGVGTFFIFSYFNLDRDQRDANLNKFYIGVTLYAVFWVADMIYAPIMAWQYNKELARLYIAGRDDAPARLTGPDMGVALIGPGTSLPAPYVLGTSFEF